MEAVLISIGTELTTGRVRESNSSWLSRELDDRGVRTVMCMTVPDSRDAIAAALTRALDLEPELVVVTGGLGPTADDMTTEAVGEALDLRLDLDPEAERMVAGAVGLEGLDHRQRKQATMPAGATPLPPAGTAPGYLLRYRSMPIVVLPGVPWEMRRMWQAALESPLLRTALERAVPSRRRRACFYDSGEARVAEAAENAFAGLRDQLQPCICARYREVTLELSYPAELEAEVEASFAAIERELSEWHYSAGEPVEAVIAGLLSGGNKTLAVGESCTGGLLGGAITRVSGSSAFYLGGVIAYHNEVKQKVLRVRGEILGKVGAVSEPVAQQLALGARSLTGADYGVGITGIAGPGGGTEEKPVGLVFICASSEEGDMVERFDFPGGREDVRAAAVIAALHMLHRKLLDEIDQE